MIIVIGFYHIFISCRLLISTMNLILAFDVVLELEPVNVSSLFSVHVHSFFKVCVPSYSITLSAYHHRLQVPSVCLQGSQKQRDFPIF